VTTRMKSHVRLSVDFVNHGRLHIL